MLMLISVKKDTCVYRFAINHNLITKILGLSGRACNVEIEVGPCLAATTRKN